MKLKSDSDKDKCVDTINTRRTSFHNKAKAALKNLQRAISALQISKKLDRFPATTVSHSL